MITPEFIGSGKGSTLSELANAAQSLGLYAKPVQNLSLAILSQSPYPVILHVKKTHQSRDYDHYVLFFGKAGRALRIYDPPNPPELIEPAALMSRWSRRGLLVSNQPAAFHELFYREWLKISLIVTVVALGILAFRKGRAKLYRVRPSRDRRTLLIAHCGQAAAIILASLTFSFLFNLMHEQGLFAQPAALAHVVEANFETFLPKATQDDVRNAIGTDAVIIDARWKADYVVGHIDGAINLEPSVSGEDIREALCAIPTSAKIIIYCQSSSCPFSGNLGRRLRNSGYFNLALFKGGWREWSQESK